MKTFIEYCREKDRELPIVSEKAVRSGTAHWAYPDGYMRSHYSALYFTPTAADAVQKMGPSANDENEVDHGQKTYHHHERMLKHEKREVEGGLLEGHYYLRKTGKAIEKELDMLSGRCSASSGTPDFRYWDSKRKELIKKVEGMRPLRRSEYIHLYGYSAWLEYVKNHGLPESHKWADSHINM